MIKTTRMVKAFFNITIIEEIQNLMTVETHYKDQNSLFSTNNSTEIESMTKI